MPIFEYTCLDCECAFDVIVIPTIDDDGTDKTVEIIGGKPRVTPRLDNKKKCPKCRGENTKREFSSFVFKM